jgi:hypothetical protein
MKHPVPLFLSAAAFLLNPLGAQPMTPVPEPEKPPGQLAVRLDAAAPLDSLVSQLADGTFDQRGELATAFDVANRSVDVEVAALRSQGLVLSPEALSNLENARDFGRQAFRDLSLTTEETWRNSRHIGLIALRKIEDALAVLRRTAVEAQ